jgi:acyl-CoA dehydrogenase
MLEDVVRAILTDVDPRATPQDGIDTGTWGRLTGSGLNLLLVPESSSGAGASFRELAIVLRAAGAAAAAVPIAEANLAAAILVAAGGSLPDGLLTLTVGGGRRRGDGRGTLEGVPYGRAADHVVWVAESDDGSAEVRLVDATSNRVETSENLAGESRDRVSLSPDAGVMIGTLPSIWDVRLRAAACRALLLSGALERVRDLTVGYADERQQFGRPLSRFQAVQQLMVETIVVSQTARAVTDAMAAALSSTDDVGRVAPLVAAARTVTGRSATVAIRCAHQVHGAIGFTVEHPLHASTRRLMAWRDEDGTQAFWSRWLGRHARMAAPATRPWHLITGTETASLVAAVAGS